MGAEPDKNLWVWPQHFPPSKHFEEVKVGWVRGSSELRQPTAASIFPPHTLPGTFGRISTALQWEIELCEMLGVPSSASAAT